MALTWHNIHVCTRCRVGDGQPGPSLIEKLTASITAKALTMLSVAEIGCMAGCSRPLTVGFSAPGKASYLFGDIDARSDAEPLLAFGNLYVSHSDRWTNEGQRPVNLAGKIIARIPAHLGHGQK